MGRDFCFFSPKFVVKKKNLNNTIYRRVLYSAQRLTSSSTKLQFPQFCQFYLSFLAEILSLISFFLGGDAVHIAAQRMRGQIPEFDRERLVACPNRDTKEKKMIPPATIVR